MASVERSAPERCELIVVNDGSRQPRTLEVLGRAARAPATGSSTSRNAGLAAARNRGIGEARGRYVLPLDADNRLLPGLPRGGAPRARRRAGAGVVYGDRLDFGLRSGRLSPCPTSISAASSGPTTIDACAVFRREVWETCGGYDAGGAGWEDWELWISAAERGWRFHRLPEVAFEYRVRPGSMLDLAEQQGRWRTAFEHVYRKHRGFYGEHLAEVLLAAKDQVFAIDGDALALRASRDALQRETDRVSREIDLIAADAIALRASRDRLQRDIDLLAAAEPWRVEQRDGRSRKGGSAPGPGARGRRAGRAADLRWRPSRASSRPGRSGWASWRGPAPGGCARPWWASSAGFSGRVRRNIDIRSCFPAKIWQRLLARLKLQGGP